MIFLVFTYDWGLYDLFISHLCMFLRGFPRYILYVYHFKGGKYCVLGVLLSESCTHMVLGFKNECTPMN